MPRLLLIFSVLTGLAVFPATAGQSLLSAHDRTTYDAAFEELRTKAYGNARLLAAKAENPMPGKVIRWLDLSRSRKDKDDPGDFADLAEFLDQNPGWPRQRNLQSAAERAMPETLSDQDVIAWFERRPPLTVAGALRYAESLRATSKTVRATKLLRETWVGFNFTAEQEADFRQRYAKLIRRDDELARLDRLLWQRKFKAARRQAARVGGGYIALTEARVRLALRRGGVDRAIKRVPASLSDDPGLTFDRARWRQRKGRTKGVIELLDPPLAQPPYPELWWRLRRWAARNAIDLGDHRAAHRIASSHGFESGLAFAEGEWLAGWIALRFIQDPKLAYQHFTRLYDGVSSPISRARGAYWAGRAAEAKETSPWAKHWYRLAAQHSATYYGQLAAERLGQQIEVDLPAAAEPTLDERASFDRRELVYVVRLLGELGQSNIQKRFLDHLRRGATTASEFQLVSELADMQGRPDVALRTAKDARLAGFILPDQLYPRPPLPEADGLDPALVFAVIRQESQFYSEAVSGAGARGLMQLMPRTAKRVAKRLKLSYRRSKLTADPVFNMTLGSNYLKQLLDRFDGSVMLALAGYNAGPSRVDKWIKLYGDPRLDTVDAVDWAERIPFSETRNYVQRITETIAVYQRQLSRRRVAVPFDPSSAALTGAR